MQVRSLFLIVFTAIAADARAQIATGGTFSLSQAVVAGGGTTSAGGSFTVEGTAGQSAAGGQLAGSSFALYGGFWTPAPLAPTAAGVTVSGRVSTASGQGISGVRLALLGSDGQTRNATSSSFGYYQFENVMSGETYILTVTSKRYVFSEPTIVLHVLDSLDAVNFVAEPL
jgi:hypothetical protein